MSVEKLPITSRDEWLAWRREVISAADVAAICGCSPYKTALQVWGEKSGTVPEPEENAAMRAGRWLEDAVIAAMRDRHPNWNIQKSQVFLRDLDRRIGATPDATARDGHGRLVNLQAKTVGLSQFKKWEGVPPIGYQLQTALEALLLEADYSILAVMTRSEWECELHEYRIDRHAKAEAQVLDMVGKFWASVADGKTPDIDYRRDMAIITKIKPPKADLEAIDLANDNHLTITLAEHDRLTKETKDIEQRIKEIRAEIIAKLDGHPVAKCNGWRIKHSMQTRNMPAREAHSHTFPLLTITRENTDVRD